jgi:WD40 repeat protein
MSRNPTLLATLLLVAAPLVAQGKRLWVLRSPGELVEYDAATFAVKQTIKVPAEAVQSPQRVSVNRLGQVLFAPVVSLPLADTDVSSPHKAWFWDGHSASSLDLGPSRSVATTGSNQEVSESAANLYLSADGTHMFWFANQAKRLTRDEIDLSTATTWQAWRTDLTGADRQDLDTARFPDCRCTTGSCEESCPYGVVWAPDNGIAKYFLMTQLIAGQIGAVYKESSRCQEHAGKWTCAPISDPLHRVLDASSDGSTIVEAIPDTGCCGWSNQSDDQTLVRDGAKRIVFDELATYKNSDYDVSFYTENARLSPSLRSIAMTIAATSGPNQPIQLSKDGQANPEESQGIRKGLAELPLVDVKSLEDPTHSFARIPHVTLIDWITDDEILILEDHVLASYNLVTKVRRRTSVRVADEAHVFLR